MVSTEQWRVAIGRWVRGYLPRGGGARGTAQGLGLLASVLGAAVMAVLLAIGGVELNPGPPTNVDIIETINRNHKELIDRIDVLQARVTSAETSVQSLQTANERLVRKVDYLENQSRRNNIIVTGIPEKRNESWADSERCILDLAEQLGVRLELQDIERAHRTGRRREGQPRMIVAKLASFRKREELLRAAREYLSRNGRVRVREDFSWAVRQTRKALIPHLQEAKASGKQASIRFDKLVVSGRSYVLAELAARPRAWEGAGRRGPVNSARGQNPSRAETPSGQAGASSRPPPPAPSAVAAAAPAAAPRAGAARTTSDPAASRRRRSRSRSRRRSRSRSRRSPRHSASPGRFAADSLERGPLTRAMAAANVQQQEARGDPSIRLPSLDPLSITEVRIQSGNQLDMHCRNIVLKGLANTELISIGIDQKNFVYSCVCRIPRLEISGDYTVDGKVLLLPIKGNGKAVFVFDDAVMHYEQKYGLEKRGDRYYLKFPESSAKFNCSKAHFTMDNLFNGDKQLGTTLNNFLNENWRAVVDDLGQPFVDAAAQVIRQFALAIVGNVPYDEIFYDVELPQ